MPLLCCSWTNSVSHHVLVGTTSIFQVCSATVFDSFERRIDIQCIQSIGGVYVYWRTSCLFRIQSTESVPTKLIAAVASQCYATNIRWIQTADSLSDSKGKNCYAETIDLPEQSSRCHCLPSGLRSASILCELIFTLTSNRTRIESILF